MRIAICLALALFASPAAAKWECTADKLKAYRYTGGGKAMIHLSPYGKGGWYRITRVDDKTVEGKTKDGTPFRCRDK